MGRREGPGQGAGREDYEGEIGSEAVPLDTEMKGVSCWDSGSWQKPLGVKKTEEIGSKLSNNSTFRRRKEKSAVG